MPRWGNLCRPSALSSYMDMACISPPSRPASSLADLPDLASLGELGATPPSKIALRPCSNTSSAAQLPPAHSHLRGRELDVENNSLFIGLQYPQKRPKSAPVLASSLGRISPETMGGQDMLTRAKSPSMLRPNPASLLGRKSPPGPIAPLLALSRSRCYEAPEPVPERPLPPTTPSGYTFALSGPKSPHRTLELAERVDPERPVPRLFDELEDVAEDDDSASDARRPVLPSRLVQLGSTLIIPLPPLCDADDDDKYVTDGEAICLFAEDSL